MAGYDEKLSADLQALGEVTPPDGFHERAMARIARERDRRVTPGAWRGMAAAACAVLLVGGASAGLGALLPKGGAAAPMAARSQTDAAAAMNQKNSAATFGMTIESGMAALAGAAIADTADTVVRRYELTLAAKDVAEAVSQLDGLGGRILVNTGSDYGTADARAYIVYAVPASQYEYVVQAARALGEVTSAWESQSDGAAELRDAYTRLAAKQTEQARLMDLLNQTRTVDDMLAVERRLSEVLSDAERYQSQIRNLEENAATPTITLNILTARANLNTPTPLGEKMRLAFGGSLGLTAAAGRGVALFAAYVAIPALLAGAALLAVWLVRRRRRR